jgi:hypothetical protein
VRDADLELVLSAEEEARVLTALEAALRPGELDRAHHQRSIEAALADPCAPPTSEELVESARLREALGQGLPAADAAGLHVLRAAFDPEPANPQQLQRALGDLGVKPRSANRVYALFGAAGLSLAVAAGLALVIGGVSTSSEPPPASQLAVPRSTTPLFSEPFATHSTSARMDRIATARTRDLRSNRFAAWGVK